MKNKFILLFLFIFVGCKSDYEKALKFIEEKDYEKATLYLNTIDSGEKNYENAKLKLKEIEKTIDSVTFSNALKAFKQKDYDEAQLLFTGFGTNSIHYQEAQKYLIIIKPKSSKENLPNENLIQEDDVELINAKKKFIKLYKELLSFKNNQDFYEYGFAVNYKYNGWWKEVEEFRKEVEESGKDEKIIDRLYDEGYPVLELQQFGLVYRGSAGKET